VSRFATMFYSGYYQYEIDFNHDWQINSADIPVFAAHMNHDGNCD
jgi:hypothetical protein